MPWLYPEPQKVRRDDDVVKLRIGFEGASTDSMVRHDTLTTLSHTHAHAHWLCSPFAWPGHVRGMRARPFPPRARCGRHAIAALAKKIIRQVHAPRTVCVPRTPAHVPGQPALMR